MTLLLKFGVHEIFKYEIQTHNTRITKQSENVHHLMCLYCRRLLIRLVLSHDQIIKKKEKKEIMIKSEQVAKNNNMYSKIKFRA